MSASETSASSVELERVLDVLLHDVRGPLGVVGGYLRLLRDQELSDPIEVERAISKAQDALRAVSDVCAQAAHWLPRPGTAFEANVPALDLAAALAAAGDRARVETRDVDQTARIAIALPLATVAAAVLDLLQRTRPDDAVIVVYRARNCLHIDAGAPVDGPAEQPFDPWQQPGLSAALACRTIAAAGGDCVSRVATPRRPSVRFLLRG